MTPKQSLLIVSGIQYGYLIDYYYHALNLADRFDITFICMDEGRPKIEPAGCKVVYVEKSSRLNRRFDMRAALQKMLNSGCHFSAAMTDFPFSSLMLFPLLRRLSDRFVFDIRTLDVSESKIKRRLKNLLIKASARRAPFVTVISDGIGRKIGLSASRSSVIPLGASERLFSLPPKRFDTMRIMYIGTFAHRHIDSTVAGLGLFLTEHPEWRPRVRYDIIGAGEGEDEIKSAIARFGLEDIVVMHGFIPSDKSIPFFEQANIGVSYIPTGERYDLQPPTKTFEYMAAGMAVIATSTSANREIVRPEAGVIADDDSAAGFARALTEAAARLGSFESEKIRSYVSDHNWADISDRLYRVLKD